MQLEKLCAHYVWRREPTQDRSEENIISEGYIPPTTFNSGYIGFKTFDSQIFLYLYK